MMAHKNCFGLNFNSCHHILVDTLASLSMKVYVLCSPHISQITGYTYKKRLRQMCIQKFQRSHLTKTLHNRAIRSYSLLKVSIKYTCISIFLSQCSIQCEHTRVSRLECCPTSPPLTVFYLRFVNCTPDKKKSQAVLCPFKVLLMQLCTPNGQGRDEMNLTKTAQKVLLKLIQKVVIQFLSCCTCIILER